MQSQTLGYDPQEGWSAPFPALDGSRTLVLAFGASELADDPAPLAELAAAFPTSHVLACSTSGEIHGSAVSDGGLAVAVVRFDSSDVATAFTEVHDAADSREAGRDLARQLLRDDLRGVFVLSDGLRVNGSELAAGLTEVLPEGVAVTGGLAGDGDRFARTWSSCGGRPAEGLVTAVGLYGAKLHIGHGSQGGWDRFGPERTITRAEGNVLFELDGQPALELYKRYLGERAEGLPATGLLFPLAIRGREGEGHSVVRTILAVDEASGSMTFAGDMPEGARAQLMRANFDRLVDGACGAAENARAACQGGGDVLSIAISCVGRRLVLGERAEDEVEATLDVLPPGTHQVGFYSYGEISPVAGGTCELHNQTMTLTTLREDP